MIPMLAAKLAGRAIASQKGGRGGGTGHPKEHRILAVFVVLCVFVAFVLSLLTVFSGNHGGFLQDGDVVQLNISRFGQTPLFSDLGNSGSHGGGQGDDDNDDDDGFIGKIWDGLKNKTETTLDDWLQDISSSLKSSLDLPDFYNVHLLNHCSGYYTSLNYTLDDVKAGDVGLNVTNCSSPSDHAHHKFLNFNLTGKVDAALSHLPGNLTLEDLHWPEGIEKAETTLKVVGHVVFVLYVMGASVVGGALLVDIAGVVFAHRIIRIAGWVLETIAFFSLMIVSAIMTVVVKKVVHAVNKAGADVGVAATEGRLFLKMTWVTVILLAVAIMVSTFLCCAGRRRTQSSEKSYFR